MSTTRPDPGCRQRGVGIIAALAATLLIGGLALMLARMTATQALSYALDDRGVRAYWAARTGLEWGAYQLERNASCAASTLVPMPATAISLSEYQVTVTCEGSGPHLLTATACAPAAECGNPESSTYVERVITRTMP
jgi:MSHA biogenesis protein MshP